jgi:anthranilate synthase component I
LLLEQVMEAKLGTVVPIYKKLDEEIDALEYFKKLSNYGNKKHSLLLQSDEKSFGSASPCLMVSGKGEDFEITPLNNLGKKFISFIKKDFKFCDKAVFTKGKILGKLANEVKTVDESEQLKLKTHLDIIRTIAFKFKSMNKPFMPYCGVFGMISSHQDCERKDLLKDPDYIFYFLDNMFVVDHKTKKTYFVANALITDNQKEKIYNDSNNIINSYEKLISAKVPKIKKPKKKELKISYDTSKDEFRGVISNLRNRILDGKILYAETLRLMITTYNSSPLDIYSQLKSEVLGNTLSYINDGRGISISSGAASFLRVLENEINFSTYTDKKSRPTTKDGIDSDLDNKYELLLKVDESEIAHNMILMDSIRNNVARVSEPGTRHVDKLFNVNKFPKYQFISSSVKGKLKEDLDALHAYSATMDTVRNTSVVFISLEKELWSMAIEPIRIKKDNLYFGKSFRVFHDSNDEKEFKMINYQEEKLLKSIKSAGGLK